MRMRTWAPTDAAHVHVSTVRLPIHVRGETTSSVVPPRTRMGGWTVRVRTGVVSVVAPRLRALFLVHHILHALMVKVGVIILDLLITEL